MKIDPVFSEAISMLFGDSVDVREAWDNVSKMDDSSEVHVPGNLKVVGKKPRKFGVKPSSSNMIVKNPINSQNSTAKTGVNSQRTVTDSGINSQNSTALAKAFETTIAEVVMMRQRGEITTEQAARGIEVIEKSFMGAIKMAGNNARLMGGAAKTAAKDAASRTKGARLPFDKTKAAEKVAANQTRAVRTFAASTGVAGFGGGYAAGRRNSMKAAVAKSDTFETTWFGEISKVDADKRQVFGWCSLSEINGEPVVDLQGDYVPIAEIEKSAYTYVLTSRKGGDMHERDGEMPLHTADMIESFVVTPEKLEKMGLPKDSLPLGWWVGFKVNDDKQWADVKDLKRTGFSIHGKGSRVEKVL